MSNFRDISTQWLHFVNKLDCYKGKENKKQLINITQVLCSHNIVTLKDVSYAIAKCYKSLLLIWLCCLLGEGRGVHWTPTAIFSKLGAPIKSQSYMPGNYLQNKQLTLHGCFDFFYLGLHIKFPKRTCLGSSGSPPPAPVNKGLKRGLVLQVRGSNVTKNEITKIISRTRRPLK